MQTDPGPRRRWTSLLPDAAALARFRTLYLCVGVALVIFAAFRGLLLWTSGETATVALWTLAVGAVYDLAFMAYALIPAVLYLWWMPASWLASRWHRWLSLLIFATTAYGLYMIEIAEWLFWDEFQARFNFIAVDYLVYRQEVTDNIAQSYPVAALVAVALTLAITTTGMLWTRILRVPPQQPVTFWRRGGAALVLMSPAIAAAVLLGQGLADASSDRVANEIARNGPYQFFAAFRANSLDYRTFYLLGDDAELSAQLRARVAPQSADGALYEIERWQNPSMPEAHGANLVLITVESLSASFLSRFGNEQGITPELDALMAESLVFTQAYATGTRTVRGLEALTLSLPPTPGRSLVKRPDAPVLLSLGSVLAEAGYDTAFMYGGRSYFDNMTAFFSANGYRIVDQSELAEDEISFENAWGVADEDLYRRALVEARADAAASRPFFLHIMTTSNHRPYTYPEGRVSHPSGSGRAGAVAYTDWAIRDFLEAARGESWFDDTVFVIVADHCASCAGREAITVANYHIPFIVHAPGRIAPREVATVASQMDVAPTLLSLLGVSYDSSFFGQDLLAVAPEAGRAPLGTYLKLGLFDGRRLVYLSPDESADLVLDPLGTAEARPASEAPDLLLETMAMYQGADYRIREAMLAPRGQAPVRAGSVTH